MKMFSDCSGECCVCSCGGGCLAGHGNDDFSPASAMEIIRRLEHGEYPSYRQYMIDHLRRMHGIEYRKIELADQNICHMTSECNEFAMKLTEKTANHKMETGREMRFVGGDAPVLKSVMTKPKTNADRIRAMSDEELAGQLVQMVIVAVKAFTGADLTADISDGLWSSLLKKLQQPAEED